MQSGKLRVGAASAYPARRFEDTHLMARNDTLRGGRGPDRLFGGRGNDVMQGGNKLDVLIGGPGRDRADGGMGRDRCSAERERRCER